MAGFLGHRPLRGLRRYRFLPGIAIHLDVLPAVLTRDGVSGTAPVSGRTCRCRRRRPLQSTESKSLFVSAVPGRGDLHAHGTRLAQPPASHIACSTTGPGCGGGRDPVAAQVTAGRWCRYRGVPSTTSCALLPCAGPRSVAPPLLCRQRGPVRGGCRWTARRRWCPGRGSRCGGGQSARGGLLEAHAGQPKAGAVTGTSGEMDPTWTGWRVTPRALGTDQE